MTSIGVVSYVTNKPTLQPNTLHMHQIFVEIERARLTRRLAAIKEAEGNISEAADILQEVAVVSTVIYHVCMAG